MTLLACTVAIASHSCAVLLNSSIIYVVDLSLYVVKLVVVDVGIWMLIIAAIILEIKGFYELENQQLLGYFIRMHAWFPPTKFLNIERELA